MAASSGDSLDSMAEASEVVVALRDYKKCQGKPWETDLRKGDLMNLLDSSDVNWWKVTIDNRRGFVRAEYLMKVNLTLPLPRFNPSQQIQGSDARKIPQGEPAGTSVGIDKRKLEKTCEGVSDSDNVASDHKRPRMDTSVVVVTSGVDKNKICNRPEQKSLTNNTKKKRAIGGSRDILTAKGTPKIAIFVAKQEKVELQDEPEMKLVLDAGNSDCLEAGNCETQNVTPRTETETVVTPMEQVLKCPKLLKTILGHLSNFKNDMKTLQSVRLVNSLWKRCAYFAFLQNPSLLPTICVGGLPCRKNGEIREPREFRKFRNLVKPSSGLPLKFHMTACTQRGMNFIKPYAGDIAHFQLECKHLEEFCIENHVSALPALETAVVNMVTHVSQDRTCSNLFLMWKALIGEGKSLKFYSEKWNDLVWSQSFGFLDNVSFLDKIIESQNLPQLRKVSLVHPAWRSRQTFKSQFLLSKGMNLTELTLGENYIFHLGPMKSLKVLNLCRGASFTGSEPLSQLLPNLVKVTALNPFKPDGCLAQPMVIQTERTSVLEKVEEIDIVQIVATNSWRSLQEILQTFTNKTVACFPNLTRLQWTSMETSKQMANSAHIVFAKLEHLICLELAFCGGGVDGLLNLLTGKSSKDIPDNRHDWPRLLEGRRDAVCNLKKLKSLKLGSSRSMPTPVVVPVLKSQFLFNPVFKTMGALKIITIARFRFGFATGQEMDCVKEWKQSGRTLVYE